MSPVAFFKCLADETRLRCLLLLAQENELCVCELSHALDEVQPKISRHLAQLKKCGLIQDRRQGQWVFYRVHPELSAWAQQVVAETLAAQQRFIQTNLSRLQKMGDRPERQRSCC